MMVQYNEKSFMINIAILLRSEKNQQTYLREKYIFSVAIQVDQTELLSKSDSYYEIAKKLAYMLTQMQYTRNLIYTHPLHMHEFEKLFSSVYHDINNTKESYIEYDDSSYIFLRLSDPVVPFKYTDIQYYMIPFPIVDIRIGLQTYFNTILEKLIPEINGLNCIGSICENLKPHTAQQVKTAVSEMVEFNLVKMVDMIHLTNVYVLNENFYKVVSKNSYPFMTATKHILNQTFHDQYSNEPNYEHLCFSVIQTLYCGFRRDIMLSNYIENNKKCLSYASLNRLIRYGQINGFLVRLYEHPITKKSYTYFDSFNWKRHLQQFVIPRFRFNEEDDKHKISTKQPVITIHSLKQTYEHSRMHETGIDSNQNMIPQRNADDKIKDANELMNQMVLEGKPIDLIGLVFNIDLEVFQEMIRQFDIYIIHK